MLFRSRICSAPTPACREAQGPQEGRSSLRRASRPPAIDTPKGGRRQAVRRRPEPIPGEEVPRERCRRGGRTTPGGDGSPREDRAAPGVRAGRQRTSAEIKARKAGEGFVESSATRSVRANARRAGPAGRYGPSRGRGNLRRAQSQERYRSETGSERTREEESVRRVGNPGGAAYRGGKPGRSRFPHPKALKGAEPWRGAVAERRLASSIRSHSEEEREFKRGPRRISRVRRGGGCRNASGGRLKSSPGLEDAQNR